MTQDEHLFFGSLQFCLDEIEGQSNHYKATWLPEKGSFGNGQRALDVEFRPSVMGNQAIPVPSPMYLRIHAAFARVHHIAAAAESYNAKPARDDGAFTRLVTGENLDLVSNMLTHVRVY